MIFEFGRKQAIQFDPIATSLALSKGAHMTQPNILIFMVDQLNGTLFPDGPAEWLHYPNLRKLA